MNRIDRTPEQPVITRFVLGVDVGKTTGVCLLDCSGARPRYVDSAAVVDDLAGVLDVRFFGQHEIAIVGIETPTQVFAHGRAKGGMGARIGIERNLLVARDAAGVVRAVARLRAQAAALHEGQAHEVRRAVLGKLPRDHVDGFVARMVPSLIDGWPARSNDHQRDAAVAALWADRKARIAEAKRRRAAA